MQNSTPAVAVTVAGSDPSGGAGIQADLKTFAAFGVYGASVITALTAQNTTGVFGVHAVPVDFISAQFDAVASDLTIGAIKTGMLADVETVSIVAECLAHARIANVVVDPVMVATSGARLIAPAAIAAVRETLLPLATLVTPNLPEAAALLDEAVAQTETQMLSQAERLLALGSGAVLLKGGHGDGAEATDVLVTKTGTHRFAHRRIATQNTHGTGCTLAAAVAAGLARGDGLERSVEVAKDYVWRALASAAAWRLGKGHGPIDHGVAARQEDSGKPAKSD